MSLITERRGRARSGNSGTGARYYSLELHISTVVAHGRIRCNQQETFTAKNAKHDNRISQKRKSTTEYTETRLFFLCVPGDLCGFAVIFPEKCAAQPYLRLRSTKISPITERVKRATVGNSETGAGGRGGGSSILIALIVVPSILTSYA